MSHIIQRKSWKKLLQRGLDAFDFAGSRLRLPHDLPSCLDVLSQHAAMVDDGAPRATDRWRIVERRATGAAPDPTILGQQEACGDRQGRDANLAVELNLEMPPKPTQRLLMRMIRDCKATPGQTVVSFGRFKADVSGSSNTVLAITCNGATAIWIRRRTATR